MNNSKILTEILIQGLGIAGLIVGILAYQSNRHKNIVFCKLANELLFGIQYVFLGAYTGALMNGLSCIRNYIFIENVKKEKSNLPWQLLFSIIIVIFGIISWESWFSLIPIYAKILTTVAYGIKNPRIIRYLTIPSSISWLVYNYHYGSVAGAVNEAFVLVSLGIAIVRFDILKKEAAASTNKKS